MEKTSIYYLHASRQNEIQKFSIDTWNVLPWELSVEAKFRMMASFTTLIQLRPTVGEKLCLVEVVLGCHIEKSEYMCILL